MMENKRIISIDALRGIVLLGILLVHTAGGFGFFSYFTDGIITKRIIEILLSNRCAPIFSTLFGISFYLILRNGNYSNKKFILRCFLLILFGLFNKLFYTYDALMWYGICGCFLVIFRNSSTKKILFFVLFFYLLAIMLSTLNLGDVCFPNNVNDRYYIGANTTEILSYPIIRSIINYFYISFQGGIFDTIAYFLFGYFLAKVGVIENLKDYISKLKFKLFFLATLGIIFFYGTYYFTDLNISILRRLGNIISFLFYSITFLWLYYRIDGRGCKYLEAYGKLGLTNYSTQSIFGVIIMSTIIIPNGYSFNVLLIIILSFYVFQCIFSLVWLKYFKYGPFEYVWRSLTNFKFSPILR